MRLGARVGRGCAELHDRMMVGLRVPRIECDELWAYVGCKQKRVTPRECRREGRPVHVRCAGASTKAIIAYRTGKRDSENTDLFIRDLRERVLGTPEISTDGFHPYRDAIRDAFGKRVAHGVISKTYSVTDLRKDAAHRYSPAAVVAVSREAVIGVPAEISTSYAERSNLSLRMASRRFTRLTNGFQQEARESCRSRVAVRRALQSLPLARNDPQHASGSPWPHRSCLVDWRAVGRGTSGRDAGPDRNRAGSASTFPGN